jgi:hypothetical protein
MVIRCRHNCGLGIFGWNGRGLWIWFWGMGLVLFHASIAMAIRCRRVEGLLVLTSLSVDLNTLFMCLYLNIYIFF